MFGYKSNEKRSYWAIEAQFDSATAFDGDYAKVWMGEESFRINKDGKCESFCPTLYRYRKNNRFGINDANGKSLIDPVYEKVGHYGGGFIAVRQHDKWGFVNEKGVLAIDHQFDEVLYKNAFQNERSWVRNGADTFFIDVNGGRITDSLP